MNIQKTANRHPTAMAIALFLNFVVLVAVAGYFLIDNIEKIEKNHTYESLHGIARLKAGHIQAFSQERKGDAQVAAKFLSNSAVRHWLKQSGDIPPAAQRPLEAAMQSQPDPSG